jgi:hypothetical protein
MPVIDIHNHVTPRRFVDAHTRPRPYLRIPKRVNGQAPVAE